MSNKILLRECVQRARLGASKAGQNVYSSYIHYEGSAFTSMGIFRKTEICTTKANKIRTGGEVAVKERLSSPSLKVADFYGSTLGMLLTCLGGWFVCGLRARCCPSSSLGLCILLIPLCCRSAIFQQSRTKITTTITRKSQNDYDDYLNPKKLDFMFLSRTSSYCKQRSGS